MLTLLACLVIARILRVIFARLAQVIRNSSPNLALHR